MNVESTDRGAHAVLAATLLGLSGIAMAIVGLQAVQIDVVGWGSSSETSPQEFLFFPGLGALIALPYVTARLTGSDTALRDAAAALVLFIPLAYLVGPVGALGVAAGLSVRNDDRLRWLAVVAFVLVAGFAFFAGAPFVAQAALALLAYPVAVLRPSALVRR